MPRKDQAHKEPYLLMASGLRVTLQDGTISPEDVANEVEILNTRIVNFEDAQLSFTSEQLKQMVKNFTEKALGRDVPVNRDHPRMPWTTTEAYGWIKQLWTKEIKNSGQIEETKLYAEIDWTKLGREMVASSAYKYTSIGVWIDKLSHIDGKTNLGMVLFELSLTNDPAFLQLPEIGGGVAQYGLMCHPVQDEGPKNVSLKEDGKMPEESNLKLELERKKTEVVGLEAEVKRLQTDGHGQKEKILSLTNELSTLKEEMEKAKRTTELDKMIKESKITPAQRDEVLKLSVDEYKGFIKGISLSRPRADILPGTGVPAEGNEGGPQGTAEDRVMLLARKYKSDKNDMVTMSEAIDYVLLEDEGLANRFHAERKS